MRFHHLGVASQDPGGVIRWIKETHAIVEESGPLFDPEQNATLTLLRTADGLTFEVVSGEQVKTLVKRGIALYHACYAVANLDDAIAELSKNGASLISAPKPAVLFGGSRVAFLHTPMGIIELLEAP
jgi:hypothetical protein